MERKNIMLAGYNGLTGTLVRKKLQHHMGGKLWLIGRKSPEETGNNELFMQTDFSEDSLQSMVFTDAQTLIICLGTTLKKAGSKENFFAIDHDMVISLARKAIRSGVKNILLVSAAGANVQSRNYYLRTKGLTEKDIYFPELESLVIFRPMLLMGNRQEKRAGEFVASIIMKFLDVFMRGPLLQFHSTPVEKLAAVIVKYTINPSPGIMILENQSILLEQTDN
jgi:nucleoside-diphosphate-sugar epimerase